MNNETMQTPFSSKYYPSDHKKFVAKYTQQIFLGKTSIETYIHDNDNSLFVDIIKAEDTIGNGIISLGTIGLSEVELINSNGAIFPTRVELCASIPANYTLWANAISTVVFMLMKRRKAIMPGDILENIFAEYYPDTNLPHLYLTHPFYWNDAHFPQIEFNGLKINWLQCLAIHENEKHFIYKNSPDDFEDLLIEKDVDIFDFKRQSVI